MSYTFPPLSRSISRSTLFDYCQRKYFFSYYTSTIQETDKELYYKSLLLKHLSSLQMWLGQKFHELISSYLYIIKDKTGENIIQFKESFISQMQKDFQLSKTRDYARYKKGEFGLSEHFYGENIDKNFIEGIYKLQNSFNNFMQSALHDGIVQYLSTAKSVFIEKKKADFNDMKIQIETIPELLGIDIRAQPDFGVVIDDETFIVYDRKTGKEPKKESDYLSDQLKIYAYKILLKIQKFRLEGLNIQCYEVYPVTMNIYGRKLIQADIESIQHKIIQDIQQRKTYLIDQNTERNQPIIFSKFLMTTNVNKCTSCRFKKVCKILKTYE